MHGGIYNILDNSIYTGRVFIFTYDYTCLLESKMQRVVKWQTHSSLTYCGLPLIGLSTTDQQINTQPATGSFPSAAGQVHNKTVS